MRYGQFQNERYPIDAPAGTGGADSGTLDARARGFRSQPDAPHERDESGVGSRGSTFSPRGVDRSAGKDGGDAGWSVFPSSLYRGVAESPAVGFVCFSVLAVSWLVVAA